jgi:NADH:ubiquinone oxidoreductase subunit 5 (subunit L)/multisubunit Na+/H+ antiporter MnhA subunit
MAVNKIGDVSFLMALGLIYYKLGTCNINIINSTLYLTNEYNILVNVLLIIAVTGKSAQLGLHM